jgi:hypothetical protein
MYLLVMIVMFVGLISIPLLGLMALLFGTAITGSISKERQHKRQMEALSAAALPADREVTK